MSLIFNWIYKNETVLWSFLCDYLISNSRLKWNSGVSQNNNNIKFILETLSSSFAGIKGSPGQKFHNVKEFFRHYLQSKVPDGQMWSFHETHGTRFSSNFRNSGLLYLHHQIVSDFIEHMIKEGKSNEKLNYLLEQLKTNKAFLMTKSLTRCVHLPICLQLWSK